MRNVILVLAIVAAIGPRASATIVLSDNFDSYADQAAFQATWPAIGTVAPTSAVLSTAQAASSPQSIQAPGTATTGQNRNRRSFSETGAVGLFSHIVWSFDFYDVGTTASASPQRNFANLQDTTAPGSTNQLISMGLNNNQTGSNSGGNYFMLRILGFAPVAPYTDPDGGPVEGGTLSSSGSSPFVKMNDFGVGLRTTAPSWRNLKLVISTNDGLSTDYSFYVDNTLAERVLNVGTAASLRSYDNIAIGSGLSNGSIGAFFDNMYLEFVPEAVPEAGSFAAVGLMGLLSFGATWIRRRRVPVVAEG